MAKYKMVHKADGKREQKMQRKLVIDNKIGDVIVYKNNGEFSRKVEAVVVGVYDKFVRVDTGLYTETINSTELMKMKGGKCHWK